MHRTDSSVIMLRAWVLERSPAVVGVSVVVAILLNGLTSWVSTALSAPLFLDSIFTLVAAVIFGPVVGAITGMGSNLFQELIFGLTGTNWQFGVVNAASGIIMGVLASRGLFRSGAHIVIATLVLTLSNAFLGTLVALFVFGGATGIEVDYISMGLLLTGKSMFWAAFLARVPVNLVDKAISVIVAFYAYRAVFVHADD